jgi:hypothetical protein
LCALAFAACGKSPPAAPAPELSDAAVELVEGDQKQLSVKNLPDGVTPVWSSDNESVVTVDQSGLVTAVSAGTAAIAVKAGEHPSLSCSVKVNAKSEDAIETILSLNAVSEDTLRLVEQQSYSVGLYLRKGDFILSESDYTVRWHIQSEGVISIANSDKPFANISTAGVGSTSIWAECVYNGKTFISKSYSVIVDALKMIRAPHPALTLVTPTTVCGANVTNPAWAAQPATVEWYAPSTNQTGSIDVSGLTFESSEVSVATVDANGVISAVAPGEAVISVNSEEYGVAEIGVTVRIPVSSPVDLDALSLFTYTLSKEDAQAALSQYYVLTNDIDYASHTRGYILPVASVADATNAKGADGFSLYHVLEESARLHPLNATGQGLGHVSFYSAAWRDILNLTDATKQVGEDTVRILKKADDSEFKGINPHGLAFTGTLDGNGYAVKNAWLMMDNFVAQVRPNPMACVANSFIGRNAGTVKNIVFDNITIGSERDAYSDGRYDFAYSGAWENDTASVYRRYVGDDAKYEMFLRSDGADYTVVRSYEVPAGWSAGRDSFAGALIFANSGVIENVRFNYSTSGKGDWYGGGLTKGGGLTYYNASAGIVRDVIVSRSDPQYTYQDGNQPDDRFLVANWNEGSVTDTAVMNGGIGAVVSEATVKYSPPVCGSGSCAAVFYESSGAMETANFTQYLDADIWDDYTLIRNLYGFAA